MAVNTMGVDGVAALAAVAETGSPAATITAACLPTSERASGASRS